METLKIIREKVISKKILYILDVTFFSIFLAYIPIIALVERDFGYPINTLHLYFSVSLFLCIFISLLFLKMNRSFIKEYFKSSTDILIDEKYPIALIIPSVILGITSGVLFEISLFLSKNAFEVSDKSISYDTLFGILNFIVFPLIIIGSLLLLLRIQNNLFLKNTKKKEVSKLIIALIIPIIFLVIFISGITIFFLITYEFEIWNNMLLKGTFKIG